MRENIERPEAIEAGVARLVGTEDYQITALSRLIMDVIEYAKMERAANPFGDGEASVRIRETLISMINGLQANHI